MASQLNTSNGMMLKVGMTFDSQQARQNLTAKLNELERKSTIQVGVEIDNERFIKTVRTYQDAMKNLVEETTWYNGAGQKMTSTITNLTTAEERAQRALNKQAKATQNLNQAQQRLNTTTKHGVSIFQDFTATFLKMAKFNTINLIYDGIINKMSEAIQITNEFDSAMTEFKKVTDTTNLSLSDYTEQLGELGEATARTTTQMLQSATEFSKAGFTPEESARLAQVASLYQNIADAEISAGEAASFITSQIKAFKDYGVEANNAITIIDKINEVSNNFSVSSSDIASALTKQSASLAAYGNDLNKSIALVTSGTEIMTGQAGKVARGLRTIGANITQLSQQAKTFDITVHGATKTIQLWNDEGTDMLDTYDVLKQISDEWDNMTKAEKSSLAITLAKKTQMDTFLAVLGNFEDAEKAYTTALLSEGSAWKENEKYMESIEAHQAKLKQQWEQLVLSAPIEDLEKSLLNAGTALLKFANSDIAHTIAKVTAFVTVVGVLSSNLIKIPSAISSWIVSQYGLNASVTAGTIATDLFTKAILSNPIFWGVAVVAGIVAVVKVIDALTVSYKEATEALDEAHSTYEQAQSDIESITNKIQELEKLKSEINEDKLEITDDKQLAKLQQQTNEIERQEASLQRQLALAKAKSEIAQQDAKKAAKDSYSATVETEKTTVIGYGEIGGKGGTVGTRFEGAITSLQSLQEKIIANNREIEKLNENYDENKAQIDEITAKNDILVQAYEAIYKEASTLADTVTDITYALGDETEAYEGSENTLGGLLDKLANLVGWKTDATDKTVELTDATEDEADEFEDNADAVDEAKNAFSEFMSSAEDMQSAYESLSKAANEYNKNGIISASTLKKLAKLNPEYINQLEVINGKMQVGNGLLQQEFENEKQLAIDAVLVAKNLRVQAICQQYVNEQTDKTKTASEQAAPKVDELKTSFHNLSIEARKAGTAVQYAYASIGNDEAKRDELQQQLDDVDKWADGMIDSINAVHLGAVESSKSAASSSKDAWKEAFEEEQRLLKHSLEMNEITEIEYYNKLKDLNEKYFGEISGKHKQYLKEYQENEEEIYKGLKSVYDKVTDYLQKSIEKGYENAINALKKEEKQVLAEIKAQIDELKREKQDVLDDINEQINGLKKKKDKVLNYWNAQIDKIKESNNHLQEQNELLEKQQALQQAKAQKVMVMKGGKFELSENESAVSQAEQALSQYQDQQSYEQQIAEMEKLRDAQVKNIEDRISALEEYKDYMDRYYDEEIDALEQYYDEVQRQYEAQIEALQEQLDAFKKAAEEQKEIEEARLAAQLLGIEKESDLFEMSLSNLSGYVEKYNSLVSQLQVPSAIMNGSIGIGHNIVGSVANTSTGGGYSAAHMTTRASGDSSFKNDEIALVGESPNAELVLGSHLNRSVNSGKLIHLSKGSGVVNAESTSTLAGLLNGVVSPTNVSNSRSTTQSFTFGNITLPNVTDGDSFVNTLSHKFNNYAIQYSSNRK